ncbi:MAG TPA: mechanosensitive ion channel domain-containing protein, partial [Reyranellaceae bacterium]|nr:mechanosensitive ion channel domain-containing protein [Reyranellaceae bacterium]
LVAIVVAGLAAEDVTRRILRRLRRDIFDRHAGESPMRAFTHGLLLDLLALLALWVAARLVLGLLGDAETVPATVGRQLLLALLYWRVFNLVFRVWLRPNTPEGRIAPVDDATAGRLLVALGVVTLLPAVARFIVAFLQSTGARGDVVSAAVLCFTPFIAGGLMVVVWHWRRDLAIWLEAMIGPKGIGRPFKVSLAHGWWVGGMVFYGLAGTAALYAALTERATAARGLAVIESALLGLLLFETLVFRLTRHLPSELPTVSDVVASCLRLLVRLVVIVIFVEAMMVWVLGAMTPAEWAPHAAALKIAALSAFGAFALWRILKFRMDAFIAANPLPAAGFQGEVDDDAPAAASRLSTLMPVLRMTAGVIIAIIGTLLVLSQLGVNITPLIAGASVLGLAVSFGSQSLVRDIVSGMFFLVEDSFRVGEYIDSGRVKGTVEGFSIRSIRLRHQNGQLHIVPFGQLGHITNFSRDWTTVKFNLSFRNDTDIELLRKTVKKIGIDMMAEPAYQKELLQPLKMQGIVDIKDAALVVRFKFTAKPKNPSLIQRVAIRRMYETFPTKDIHFALPPVMFPGLAPAPPPPQN